MFYGGDHPAFCDHVLMCKAFYFRSSRNTKSSLVVSRLNLKTSYRFLLRANIFLRAPEDFFCEITVYKNKPVRCDLAMSLANHMSQLVPFCPLFCLSRKFQSRPAPSRKKNNFAFHGTDGTGWHMSRPAKSRPFYIPGFRMHHWRR